MMLNKEANFEVVLDYLTKKCVYLEAYSANDRIIIETLKSCDFITHQTMLSL